MSIFKLCTHSTPTKKIYRVWLIYSRSWKVIIFPMLTLTGTLACSVLFIWELSQLKPGQPVFQKVVSATTPAMFALPFATNLTITALIVFRIKKARVTIAGLSAGGVGVGATDAIYKRVIWGVVESCAIYPLFLLLAIILYFLKSNALALITGPMTQVVTIVPTLMWIQVILGRSQYEKAAQLACPRIDSTLGTHISFRSNAPRTPTWPDGERRLDAIVMSDLKGESDLESQDRKSVV